MTYRLSWEEQHVTLTYEGTVDNGIIERAHFELNGDGRYYDCHTMVIDLLKANMSSVDPEQLIMVVATDFGASKSNRRMKVAMLINDPAGVKTANHYIAQNILINSPWTFKIFSDRDSALQWFNAS